MTTPRRKVALTPSNTPSAEMVMGGWWGALFSALERVAPEVLEDLHGRVTGTDDHTEEIAGWARDWHLDHEAAREAVAVIAWHLDREAACEAVAGDALIAFYEDEILLAECLHRLCCWPERVPRLTVAWLPSVESRAAARARLTRELRAWVAQTAGEAGARCLTVNPEVLEQFVLWQCLGWDAARIATRYGKHGTRSFTLDPATGARVPGPWRYGRIHSELKRTAAALGLALRRGRPGKRPAAR